MSQVEIGSHLSKGLKWRSKESHKSESENLWYEILKESHNNKLEGLKWRSNVETAEALIAIILYYKLKRNVFW